jgi:DNA gyrase inhibitor GyrI
MARSGKKSCLVLVVGFGMGIFIIGMFFAARMGAFRSVEMHREQRPTVRIVCLPHSGPYNQIGEKINEVKKLLEKHKDALGRPCAIYYDDPDRVPDEKLRSKGGYILKQDVELPPELEVVVLAERDVLVARFKGHVALAAAKIYPSMSRWMADEKVKPAGPSVEYYEAGVVECEMPIQPE